MEHKCSLLWAQEPLPSVHKLSQINPLHVPSTYSWKIHFNIIFPSNPRHSKWSLSFRMLHWNPVCTYSWPHMCHMSCISHPSLFDHLNDIWWGVQIKKPLIMQSPPLPCCLIPLGPNIFHSTLFSNTLSLYSSLSVRAQIHTHTKQEAKL